MIRQLRKPVPATVEVLELADVAKRSRRWNPFIDTAFIERSLELMPGRSVWIPSTEEIVVVSPWRNRLEVGAINAINAVAHADALFREAASLSEALGDEGIVSVEWDVARSPGFFERIEFDSLQEIVSWDLEGRQEIAQPSAKWPSRIVERLESSDLAGLVRLDHAAFDWLWWNSEAEFLTYGMRPGVEIIVIEIDNEIVGYIGYSDFGDWGHIDRIAVAPALQGQGIASELMRLAVARMRRARAKRIELSTQTNNVRSRVLYEHLGFRVNPASTYRVFGRYFGDHGA